jgi:hypothetical protein
MKRVIRRLRRDVRSDEGTATAEYAIATMAIVIEPRHTLDSAHVPEHSNALNAPG